MGMFRSTKFLFAGPMPVAKAGFFPPLPLSPNAHPRPKRADPTRDAKRFAPEFSPADQKHSFVVKALEKPGLFKSRPYIYICLRCRYAFLVNERRGSIVALDRKAQPIPEPENFRRLSTFAQGPCPAFPIVTERRGRGAIRLARPMQRPSSGFFQFLGRIAVTMRYPYSFGNSIEPPTGISPQDLLS